MQLTLFAIREIDPDWCALLDSYLRMEMGSYYDTEYLEANCDNDRKTVIECYEDGASPRDTARLIAHNAR